VRAWNTRRSYSLPITAGVTGLLLGAGSGWFWLWYATGATAECEAADAVNPESMCGLGFVIWGPAIILVAAVVNGIVAWLVLAAANVRPRANVLTTVPPLTVVAAFVYRLAATAEWYRILVPAAILGCGLTVVATVERWRWPSDRRPHAG
jgi:hypothetical protein